MKQWKHRFISFKRVGAHNKLGFPQTSKQMFGYVKLNWLFIVAPNRTIETCCTMIVTNFPLHHFSFDFTFKLDLVEVDLEGEWRDYLEWVD